ncbi:hypothetical protein L2E82_25609 [Cichorium intybus]|uniref:Uncharacterized protein n=1 Tax=Cichorium intybus TaxID=13427 RepID=A0ACB9E4J1_CICIN|nr:hypothetical protein L2E82_25609 [Cichorium intybus]
MLFDTIRYFKISRHPQNPRDDICTTLSYRASKLHNEGLLDEHTSLADVWPKKALNLPYCSCPVELFLWSKKKGVYVKSAAEMAVGLGAGVVWVMLKNLNMKNGVHHITNFEEEADFSNKAKPEFAYNLHLGIQVWTDSPKSTNDVILKRESSWSKDGLYGLIATHTFTLHNLHL